MAEKTDRRIRKTRAQLRAGLARLMQKKNIHEITVTELVDEVDINRSTFYLHYDDIYQMLESIEQEIMDEIQHSIENNPIDPTAHSEAQQFIVHIFHYLEENREICNSLLGPHGDMAFVERTEKLVSETVFASLTHPLAHTTPDFLYTYAFCLTGLVGMVKAWLSAETAESPQYMAELTHRLFATIAQDFIKES